MSATEEIPVPSSPQPTVEKQDPDKPDVPAQPTRSWRKKYRKLRQRFARAMSQSTNYTKEESRALAVARRLQEETDQLLEILMGINHAGILETSPNTIGLDIGSDIASLTTANTADTEESYLSALLHMPHRNYELADLTESITQETPSNYMDSSYREEYIINLDSQIIDDAFLTDPNKTFRAPASRLVPSEKELQTRNADSVISWLRRNHPETFIQDKDHEKEKPEPRKRNTNKRASLAAAAAAAAVVKAEPTDDIEEDVVAAVETPKSANRGKKAKDDEPYRPKGGSSRGKRKRGEDDSGKSAARGKRAKA